MQHQDVTRNMLSSIRKIAEQQRRNVETPEDFNRRINESEEGLSDEDHGSEYKIRKDDVKFGKLLSSQEEQIRKTIGSVSLDDDALTYYTGTREGEDDLVLNGHIPNINLTFQFRYNDPSGDGCYIWGDGIQMTDSNNKTVDELRNAFLNWKDSINKDGTIFHDLRKATTKQD